MDVLTSPISDSVTCLIKDTCTAVSCCMDIDFLQRSFESYITIDACNHWIHVGIEKLSFNISFDDLSFGTYYITYSIVFLGLLLFTIATYSFEKIHLFCFSFRDRKQILLEQCDSFRVSMLANHSI